MINILISTLLLCFNNILPEINTKYSTTIKIPLIGKQHVEYERTSKLISEIKLTGKINKNGKIFFNINNPSNYELDNNLLSILQKYKCTLYNPYYDNEEDKIIVTIKINIIKFTKNLILTKND